jgi:hypothetical protein
VTSAVEESAEAGGAAGGGGWAVDVVVDTSKVWSITDAVGAIEGGSTKEWLGRGAAAAASGTDADKSMEAGAAGLSLERCANTVVESVKAKAISGGELGCVEGEAASVEVEGAAV